MTSEETPMDFNEWSRQFDDALENSHVAPSTSSSPPFPGRSPPSLPSDRQGSALFSPGTAHASSKTTSRRAWRKTFRRKSNAIPASSDHLEDVEMKDQFAASEEENSMEGGNQTDPEPKRFSPNLESTRKRQGKHKAKTKTKPKAKARQRSGRPPSRPAIPPPNPPVNSPPRDQSKVASLSELGIGLLGLSKEQVGESVHSDSFTTIRPDAEEDDEDADSSDSPLQQGSRGKKGRTEKSEGLQGLSRKQSARVEYKEVESSGGAMDGFEGLRGLDPRGASTRVGSEEVEEKQRDESPKFSLGGFNVLKKRLNRSRRGRNPSGASKSSAKAKAQEETDKILKLVTEMINEKQYEDALALLEGIRSEHTKSHTLVMHHAICALKLQRFTKVVLDCESIERSFESRTKSLLPSMLTLKYAGEALIRLGSHDLATAYLNRAKEVFVANPGVSGLNPSIYLSSLQTLTNENDEALSKVGQIDVEISRLDRDSVLRCAEEMLRIAPSSPRAQLVLILGKFVLGSDDEAWAIAQMKIALSPALDSHGLLLVDLLRNQLGDVVASCARLLHRSGLMEEALSLLRVFLSAIGEALGLGPSDEVKVGLYETKESIGTQAQSYEAFHRAKSAANDKFRSSDYSGAVKLYTEAMRIDKTHKFFNSIMLCNRAAAYMAMNEFVSAEEDCSLALRYRVRYVRARLRRARCRVALGKLEAAVQDFKRAYEMEKDEEILAELRRVELTQKARARANSSNGGEYTRASGASDGFSYSKYHERSKRFHSQNKCHGETEEERNPHYNYYRYSKYTYYSSSTPRKERPRRQANAPRSESSSRRRQDELDPYETLGVRPTDSAAVIRKAYLKLCLKYHPDKNPKGEEMYKKVQQAFDILKDKDTKEVYDTKQRMWRRHSTYGGFAYG